MKLAPAKARSFIAHPGPPFRAALLYGPNRALVAESAQAVAAHFTRASTDPFAIVKLSEDDLRRDKARLLDALCGQSLLGGPGFVLLRAEGEGVADAALHALKEMERGAATGFLLIEGGALSGSGKLVKGFEASAIAAAIAFYEESEADLHAFLQTLLREEGLSLEQAAPQALLGMLPPDRALLRQEVAKLATYAGGAGQTLTLAEVEALVADEGEAALDEAAKFALAGKGAQSVETLYRMDAMSGVSALKAMERRLLRLLETRSRMDLGATAEEAAAKLRPPVFWKERDLFRDQVRRWTTHDLLQALNIIWRAERSAMQAQRPQETMAMEAYRAVAGLGARRG